MRDSIERAVRVLLAGQTPDWVLLVPGDSPALSANLVANVIEQARLAPDAIVIPVHGGRRGHPVAFPWALVPEILDLPSDVGVNALVARHRDRVVEIEQPDDSPTIDLDTPEDWEHWQSRNHAPPDQVQDAKGNGSQNSDPTEERLATGSTPIATGGKVTVRLFALARQLAGRGSIVLALPEGATVADLREALRRELPALGPLLARAMIAVNEDYAGDDAPVPPGTEAAVIPPVSGGGDAGEHRPGDNSRR
jgi:molybdopterin converting factor small subunit